VRVELVDAQRQGPPDVRRGLRLGAGQGHGLLDHVVGQIARLAIDRDGVDLQIGRQLAYHGLGLDPQFPRGPLDAQRQHMARPVRQALGRGNRAARPAAAAHLGHIPAQAQRAEDISRVLRCRHRPSPD